MLPVLCPSRRSTRDHRPQYSRKRSARLFFFFLFRGKSTIVFVSFLLCASHISLKVLPKSCKRLQTCADPPLRTAPVREKQRSSEDVRCTSCFLGFNIYMYIPNIHIYILMDSPPPMLFCFISSYMYGLLLCVCLTSVWNLEKYETKKMTKALQRGQKTVCWWNSDHVV